MFALKRFYAEGTPGPGLLVIEGAVAAVMGTAFGYWLFPKEVSLVCVFLASIASADSAERLLAWNRRAIFDEGWAPRRANLRLTALILAMFAGCVLGFSALVFAVPLELAETVFSHQLEDYGDATFATLQFGNMGSLFLANLYVLLFFFVIAMPFRQGGVMLAVAWNASVWGATFGVLARRWSESDGPHLAEAYVRVIAAVTPHMALEAFAYVLAGFAGVFLSKGLEKYDMESDVLLSILQSVAGMLGFALICIFAGALWEGSVAGQLVQWLS